MKLLLDTHAVLWFWWDDARLAENARRLIADATNEKLVSLATPWEVAIKVSLGKLDVGEPFTGFFPTFMSRSSFERLPMRQPRVAKPIPAIRSAACCPRLAGRRSWAAGQRPPAATVPCTQAVSPPEATRAGATDTLPTARMPLPAPTPISCG